MKKILIIGGCGYIGSSLYLTFGKVNKVETVDTEWFGNFVNTDNIKDDFDNLKQEYIDKFDVIIFVAANSSVKLCEDLYDSFNNNVIKFVNFVKKLKHQKFIYASSSCVYVTSDNEPKVETDSLSPLDGLTLSKTTIDQYMALTNIEYYGLRFGSVNGWSPNMRLDLMINAMTLSAQRDKVVNVFNGHAYRPILSISDLCRAVYTIVNSKEDNRGVYNIASFNDNILEIGKKVSEFMDVPMNNLGKNFTYDFSISSQKFIEKYDFQFLDTVELIAENISSRPYNENWGKREKKPL